MAAGPCAVCYKSTEFKCTSCADVYYCCKEHQTQDWSNHKFSCTPYQLGLSPELGNILIASRPLKKGATIIREDPFVFGPVHFQSSPCCIGCCGTLEAVPAVCSKCDWPVCDKDCPGLKTNHKKECKYMKKLKLRIGMNWELVLPLRCVLLNVTVNNASIRDWLNTNAIPAYTKLDAETLLGIDANSVALKSLLTGFRPLTADWSEEGIHFLVEAIMGILNACSLHYKSSSGDRKAGGLYKSASLLQHSCTPNTRPCFNDGDVDVYRKKGHRTRVPSKRTSKEKQEDSKAPVADVPNRGGLFLIATRDIQEGEILTCARTNPLMNTIRRQHDILTNRKMHCRCARCADQRELGTDYGTLKCDECGGSKLPVDTANIRTSNWWCEECGMTSSIGPEEAEERFSYFLRKYEMVAQDEMIGRMDVKALERIVTEAEKKLHPNHEACIALKFVTMNAYGYNPKSVGIAALDDNGLKRKAELGRQVADMFLKLGPSVYRAEGEITQCLIEHAKTLLECIKRFYERDGVWTHERAKRAAVRGLRQLKHASEIIDLPNLQIEDEDYNVYVCLIYSIGRELVKRIDINKFDISEDLLYY